MNEQWEIDDQLQCEEELKENLNNLEEKLH
jgi:hypothetical protein